MLDSFGQEVKRHVIEIYMRGMTRSQVEHWSNKRSLLSLCQSVCQSVPVSVSQCRQVVDHGLQQSTLRPWRPWLVSHHQQAHCLEPVAVCHTATDVERVFLVAAADCVQPIPKVDHLLADALVVLPDELVVDRARMTSCPQSPLHGLRRGISEEREQLGLPLSVPLVVSLEHHWPPNATRVRHTAARTAACIRVDDLLQRVHVTSQYCGELAPASSSSPFVKSRQSPWHRGYAESGTKLRCHAEIIFLEPKHDTSPV